MANDLSTRLTLDGSNFNQELENATTKVEKFQDATSDATKSIQDLGSKGSRSAKELLSEINKISGAERSTSNYRRQLAQMQRDIADLTINYRAMSTEMKNSAIGQETLSKIQELTTKAGQYKDAIIDAQQSVAALASDTAMWDGMKMGIDAVSAGLQGFVSMGVLGEQSTEKLVAVIAKLKGIEAATNAVIKIGNALQKNSALMMSISTLQARALAKAKTLEAAATGKATVAQKLFNIVANANPYVLLATAVITVVSALAVFSSKSNEAKKKQEEQTAATEKAKEEMEEYAKTVGSAAGNIGYKFNSLKSKYQGLKTTMEKTTFLKENKKDFEDLGISLNNINDADNVFINNASAFEQAVVQRARASAMFNLMAKNWEKYAESIETLKSQAPFKAGQIVSQDQAKLLGHENDYWMMGTSDRQMGRSYVTLNEQGAAQLNAEWLDKQAEKARTQLDAANARLQEEVNAANDAYAAILKQYGIKPGGSGGNDGGNQIQAAEGSLQWYQNKVSALQTQLNNMSPDNASFAQVKNDLAEAQANVERIQALIKGNSVELFPEGSLKEANHFVQVFTQQLQDIDPSTDEFQEILDLLNAWKQRQKEINDLINGTEKASKSLLDKYHDAQSAAAVISEKFKIGLLTLEEAQDEIQKLNDGLSSEGITAKVKLELDEESIKTVTEQFDEFIQKLNDAGNALNVLSSINSTYEAFKNLGDTLSEAENGWESFFAIFQAGMQMFNTFTSILQAVNTVMELLNVTTATGTAVKNADTTATIGNTAAKEANTTASIGEGTAEGFAAASKGANSVASIPYIGPILAVAAIVSIMAAIMGALASAKAYATGGIIGGNSTHGDKILARVNSGEMVINQGQQAKLWNFINGDTLTGSQNNVEFKIRGTDLIGVIQNSQKKTNRI